MEFFNYEKTRERESYKIVERYNLIIDYYQKLREQEVDRLTPRNRDFLEKIKKNLLHIWCRYPPLDSLLERKSREVIKKVQALLK